MLSEQPRPLDGLSTQDWSGPRDFLYPPSAEHTSPPPYRSLTESPSHVRIPPRSHVPPPFTPLPNRRRRSGPSLAASASSGQVSGISLRPLTSAGRHYLRPRSNTTGGGRTDAHFQAYANDMSAPDSNPPPYSPTPPIPIRTTSVQRATSSPHLRASPCTQFFTYSSTPSSSSLPAHPPPRTPAHVHPSYSHSDLHADPSTEGHDLSDTAASDDDVIYAITHADAVDTPGTHHRLLMRKERLRDEAALRQITTAHGVPCAGETETEGEDSVSAFTILIIILGEFFHKPIRSLSRTRDATVT